MNYLLTIAKKKGEVNKHYSGYEKGNCDSMRDFRRK